MKDQGIKWDTKRHHVTIIVITTNVIIIIMFLTHSAFIAFILMSLTTSLQCKTVFADIIH